MCPNLHDFTRGQHDTYRSSNRSWPSSFTTGILIDGKGMFHKSALFHLLVVALPRHLLVSNDFTYTCVSNFIFLWNFKGIALSAFNVGPLRIILYVEEMSTTRKSTRHLTYVASVPKVWLNWIVYRGETVPLANPIKGASIGFKSFPSMPILLQAFQINISSKLPLSISFYVLYYSMSAEMTKMSSCRPKATCFASPPMKVISWDMGFLVAATE